MKLFLINPKSSFMSHNLQFQLFWKDSAYNSSYKHNWSGISSSLLTVAALTPPDYDIKIIDENIEEINFEEKIDLVGITAMTHQAERAYEIAGIFKSNGIPVIMGGIHPTILYEEAMQHCTSVVIGEAENIWPKVISDFETKRLERVYKEDETYNLINAPIPRYDLLISKHYSNIWVQTSRGCPHDCDFCASSKIYGKKYRYKTNDQIIKEVEFIKKHLKNVTIGFSDDNLFVNKKKSLDLLEKLIPLNIRWVCQSDISIAQYDNILELIKRSGCQFIFIGFETLSKDGLLSIDKTGWKAKQLEKYPEYIEKIQSKGIGVMGAFIIGLDGDDISVFDNISNFIIENKLYDAQISISTPLPGTRLRDKYIAQKRLLGTKWSNYTVFDVNFIHPTLTKSEIEYGLVNIYKKINSKEFYETKLEHFKKINLNLIKQGKI